MKRNLTDVLSKSQTKKMWRMTNQYFHNNAPQTKLIWYLWTCLSHNLRACTMVITNWWGKLQHLKLLKQLPESWKEQEAQSFKTNQRETTYCMVPKDLWCQQVRHLKTYPYKDDWPQTWQIAKMKQSTSSLTTLSQ